MLAGLAAAFLAAPAAAQLALEAALQTDYRVRGSSVSDGEPAASLSASYDDPSGFYVGGSSTGSLHDGDPELLGFRANAGYATRISPDASIDAGISHTHYLSAFGTGQDYDYTELYLGMSIPNLSARVYYSPAYYYDGTPTLYAELDGGIEPAEGWFLSAHAGVLAYLDEPPLSLPKRRFDWRIGASRQFGRVGVHLDLSGRVERRAYGYLPLVAGGRDDATALVASLTRAF